MNQTKKRFNPYLFTISVVLGIGALKLLLAEVIQIGSPLLLFFTAVTLAAWHGGALQGLLASLLSILFSDYFFIEPFGFGWSDPTYYYRFFLYLLDCIFITILCTELKRYKEKASHAGSKASEVERFLKDSELRFRRVYDSNMIGLLFGNTDGVIYEANDYFLNMLGYTREDFHNHRINWKDLTPPEYLNASLNALEQLKTTGLVAPFEKEYIKKDGGRVPVIVGSSLLDKDSNVTFVLNITERKRADKIIEDASARLEEMVSDRTLELKKTSEQMKQSQSFLGSVIENIPNMIFVKDAKELRFMRFNKAGEDLLGYPRDTLLGKNDYDFFPKEQADFFTQKDREVLKGKTVIDIPEEALQTKNGVRFLHTKKIPILNDKGEPEYLLGISEDITAKKEAEQQRLVLAQEQASSRAKSAFLANMSHEIRTPLGAMLGFADLILENGNLSAEQTNYITTIIRNGKQLYRIVDEILDLSKVESDTINLEKISFSLKKLIQEVASLLKIQAQEKNIELLVTYEDALPDRVVSDPTRLRQILINVIGNAIKFTPTGSVQVQVDAHASKSNPSNTVIAFQVQDTGIGITNDQAQKLFQPFVQADDSMTRKYGGTGLGLFLSRKLAKLLGGDLTLKKSIPLKGSLFEVTIEVQLSEDLKKGTKINKTSHDNESTPTVVLGKVLVVDDVPDNRALVSHHIKRMGFDSDVAENGKEGLKKALEESYDIILMDLQMPDMDGFEAVMRLRKANYKGPIIALTAHAMKGDKERCLMSGFDDYLCKPIDKNLLKDTIFKFSKKSSGHA